MTPMNEGILYGIFFLFRFHDRKLSSPTRKSCTLPHCLTSGRYGSLIGSLVVMRDCEAGRNSNTGGLGAKRACAQFKNSSCVFRSRVRSLHVFRPLSATRSLILNVSTCSMVCRHHDDPTNGPTGDPSMVCTCFAR